MKASSEKVENVVNPPQKPTFKNKLVFEDIFRLSANPTIKPIKIAPSKFTTKVRKGNCDFIGIKLIAYRPIAQPRMEIFASNKLV